MTVLKVSTSYVSDYNVWGPQHKFVTFTSLIREVYKKKATKKVKRWDLNFYPYITGSGTYPLGYSWKYPPQFKSYSAANKTVKHYVNVVGNF